MNVKLISYTQGTDGKNLLEQVAYAARVSNPSNQDNNDTAEKLVRYLIKHQHWSPLEMVNVCLEIETTRDIARQILRHRSFSFQEFSQRYAVADLGFEFKEARLQDEKNRQNSIETDNIGLKLNWETQHISKFSWGVSNRGASIRVPLNTTHNNWASGYLEDRRPASHADPYKIVKVISDSLDLVEV